MKAQGSCAGISDLGAVVGDEAWRRYHLSGTPPPLRLSNLAVALHFVLFTKEADLRR